LGYSNYDYQNRSENIYIYIYIFIYFPLQVLIVHTVKVYIKQQFPSRVVTNISSNTFASVSWSAQQKLITTCVYNH